MTHEVYLIDGSAYIYRAYHAVVPLSNSQGLPTHAIFGFLNILRRLFREKNPKYIAVAFDARGPVFRHELYGDYKANRPSMPEDLVLQIPYIKELVQAMNIPSFEIQGIEADDIIASAARVLGEQGFRVVVVSGDKDLLQLVDEQVVMWDPMKDKVMDIAAVEAKYHVKPEQLLDCYALMGDSSDNVPGVPGVGPKTAEKLINQYGSLEGVYAELADMKKSKLKERLDENRESAFLSRDLIRLKYDADIPDQLSAYQVVQPDEEMLQDLYRRLEFTSMLKVNSETIPVPKEGFQLVRSGEELQSLVGHLSSATLLVIDTETTSLDVAKASLVGISLCTDLDAAWYIPVGHRTEEGQLAEGQLDLSLVLESLRPFLEAKELPKLGHNIKYDYSVLRSSCNLTMDGPLLDSMIAAYLVEPERRSLKLDTLCQERGYLLTPFKQVVADVKRDDCFAYVGLAEARDYSCEDVFGALLLWQNYEPILEKLEQRELFFKVETPLIPILAEMELAGIVVSGEILDELAEEFQEELSRLEEEIYTLAGYSFNIQSPKQMGKLLFEELQLPHGRKTKSGYSTDIKVLEKLAFKHEIPAKIIRYRTLAKLLSTYVKKLKTLIDPVSGRVHTSFNQTVTATGRLSSSNPNLQNIPIRTVEGNRIRQAFIPEKGLVFLSADYSQIDLRVLAHYSQDPALLQAFRRGEDIHARTAAELFGVSPLLLTSEMRRVAKSINFGIVYGMSSFGLSGQLGISRKEASDFIDKYFRLYGGVKVFMGKIVEQARVDGYVTTLLNRRRLLPEILAKDKTRREFSERTAINTPIQGTAADVIKLAMIEVVSVLKDEGLSARLLLQIHDELVFELPESELDRTRNVVKSAMENALKLDVPLVVNFEVGTSLAKV
ncbi:MAG: DNA polymerase I [Proteobacteria bacterium]|nr:DNA polymerase I [Pseudomonadota bacterium]MBU1139143.1 DNA polymerase I [Pseudomonadota bacterium]MBU1234977.1 DNA polymerase I [Pseudomonadota bacterium]MBU1417598.1 DNA polymerase I [Pseudomonadota bacterium]MBU1454749.1 DNA polymerase I [Pseudomonadota bacterium]